MSEDNPLSGSTSIKDMDGLVIPPVSSQNAGEPAPSSIPSASAEHVEQRKKRSDAGKPRGSRAQKSGESISPLSQIQFAQLYSPEIWAKALAAPGDAMAAITGRKLWEISPNERQALGATGSVAAQCFAVSDPKYLALSLCLITLLDVYGVRIALELAEKKRISDEKKKASVK